MSSFAVSALIEKMQNLDADFRFMALNDLMAECARPNFSLDTSTENQIVNQVLALMKDSNTEVKNQAVKAIGSLVKKIQEERLLTIVDQLTTYSAAPKDEQLRDIANLGLRTVIREISPTSTFGATTCNKLTPKLIDQLNNKDASQDGLLNSAELMNDVFLRFDTIIGTKPELQQNAVKALIPLLSNGRPAIRKRAVDGLAQLIATTPATQTALLDNLLTKVIHPGLADSTKVDQTHTAISLVGALAQRAPTKIGPRLDEKSMLMKIVQAGQIAEASDADLDEDEDATQVAAQAELREAVLQTLERLLVKCPKEMTTFVEATKGLASSLISWDPNFAGGGDDEDDVEMNADEDEDDDYADDYSDDDDVSWKVRRAATKVLSAAIETRPELCASFCRTLAPLLTSRFSEREESVRLEVWSTFKKLLEVVGVLQGTSPVVPPPITGSVLSPTSPSRSLREDTPNTLKRKRGDNDGNMQIVEELPSSILRGQVGAVAKAIAKQLNSKSVAVRQAGFSLLHTLITVLRGGLEEHLSSLVLRMESALTSTAGAAGDSSSGSSTSLKIVILSFLTAAFAMHSPDCFGDSLEGNLVPCLIACSSDKHNKVAAIGFQAQSALVKAIRPVNKGETPAALPNKQKALVQAIYMATVERLSASNIDQEVREAAIGCLGNLLYHAGDELATDYSQSLSLLKDAMRREVTRLAAVRNVARVASSPVVGGPQFATWVQDTLGELALFLKQNNRVLKMEAFSCLPILIRASGDNLAGDTVSKLLEAVAPFLSASDLQFVPLALSTVDALLNTQSKTALSAPAFSKQILPSVMSILSSSSLQGPALEALLGFFGVLVANGQDSKALIKQLSEITTLTSARCIGAVVKAAPQSANEVAAGFVTKANAPKGSTTSVAFSLYALGEVGRVAEFTEREKASKAATTHFSSSTDEVRSAAAFALGNLAVGNPDKLLPLIVSQIAADASDDKKLSLSLHALKEFISHASPEALSSTAESLWTPLFTICSIEGPPPPEAGLPATAADADKKAREKRAEAQWKSTASHREKWKQTENSRNVSADCLGKITLTDPNRFLPQLQARLQDSLAGIRAAVISAIRFTLVDDSPSFDDALAPFLSSFLSLMRDPDIHVRRSALSAFNSAAHHKPHLVRMQLHSLLPLLYEETVVNSALIRFVEMGPFKHKVDDGLEVRKAAYETCYTLLDTSFAYIDPHELLARVLSGITDDNEIRAISYLMLIRLAQVSPTVVSQSLDASADAFTSTFDEKLKDNAVKQEQEKHQQMQRSALRAFVALSRLASTTTTPKFAAAVKKVRGNTTFAQDFKDIQAESQISGEQNGSGMDID